MSCTIDRPCAGVGYVLDATHARLAAHYGSPVRMWRCINGHASRQGPMPKLLAPSATYDAAKQKAKWQRAKRKPRSGRPRGRESGGWGQRMVHEVALAGIQRRAR